MVTVDPGPFRYETIRSGGVKQIFLGLGGLHIYEKIKELERK